jgi:uncharacterized protein YbjT (DUF2867 family)
METNVLVVVGATGGQGGGLARAILDDASHRFALRVVTRKPASDRARALASRGAVVVYGDADDAASLRRAFAGAYGAFCVTNFWEHRSPQRDFSQAAAMAEAAHCAGLQHVIWSTLEDTRRWIPLADKRMPTLMERYKVPHFDAKGEADGEFVRLGVPTTFLLTSFYWDNFISFPGTGLRRTAGQPPSLMLPMDDKRLPGIAVEDIGRCAYGVFTAGAEYVGRRIGIAGEHLTGVELAGGLSRALGQDVRYVSIPSEEYARLDVPNAADLANMFQFKREFQDLFCGARSVELSRRLNPSLQNFDQWLGTHRSRLLA